MLIVLTGVEKSGKTTLARRIDELRPAGLHVAHFHFRGIGPHGPGAYLEAVKLATRQDVLVVLERSWADEAVYPRLLGRAPGWDELEAEWCLAMAARSLGPLFVLPNAVGPRDEHDVVDPAAEEEAWRTYAKDRPWWTVLEEPPDPADLVLDARAVYGYRSTTPPTYAGARYPRVVLVGEGRNENSRDPMFWGPLTTRTTRRLAHVVPSAVWPHLGLTNAVDLVKRSADRLRSTVAGADLTVALGGRSAGLLADHGVKFDMVAPHPAAVFRWGRYAGREMEVYRPTVEAALRAVKPGLKLAKEETVDART